MSEEYPDEDYPCETCASSDWCDSWEAKFCCELCNYLGGGDCDNCDPMDI